MGWRDALVKTLSTSFTSCKTLLVFFVCLCFVFYVLITSSSRLTEVTALAQWCLISVHIFLPNLCQLSGITAMVFLACIVEKSKNKITKGSLFTGLSVCLLNNRSVHSSVRSFILNASACLFWCEMKQFPFFYSFSDQRCSDHVVEIDVTSSGGVLYSPGYPEDYQK